MKNALACLAIVSAFTVFALQACGGDDNKSDAGRDGTTTDAASDAGQDVQQQGDGGACPNYTGSVTLCKAAIQRCNTCGAATTKFTLVPWPLRLPSAAGLIGSGSSRH